ncbi:FAD binding domain-containing protein [Rhizobium sp. 11_C7_N12_5]|uniref:FAD binding domain-containing protein n=1 Tax=Rhizobium sp. 11_C7_N12_5 TaxID=3240770 RepID=UPI003F27EC34
MLNHQKTDLYQPETIADSLAILAELGSRGAVMAGGTWIMRAPLRNEALAQAYVTIARIPELHQVVVTDTHVTIGSGVTHAQLARDLQGVPELSGMMAAAGDSANPAVRQTATVGGNLCAVGFPAADIVPALLCQGAEVEFETLEGGRRRMGLAAFQKKLDTLQPASLLLHILVPRRRAISAHARLPLRKAGDYPVAIASVSVERRPDGLISNAAIGIGSVEAAARRWGSLEEAISGLPYNSPLIQQCASDLAGEFVGRDGPEVPGWYRVHVLPTLVRRAFEKLQKH